MSGVQSYVPRCACCNRPVQPHAVMRYEFSMRQRPEPGMPEPPALLMRETLCTLTDPMTFARKRWPTSGGYFAHDYREVS